jgi:hypothetical protein
MSQLLSILGVVNLIHTSEIGCRPCSERSHNIPNGIDSVDDAPGRSSLIHLKAEISSILGVGINSLHQRTIVAVDA